jgi:hypothetical protein
MLNRRQVLISLAGLPCALLGKEVQAHGFEFEQWLRQEFFQGYQPEGYTQAWDIPARVNTAHGHIPVNPKAAKYGSSIGLGDALRQFQIAEPFLLVTAFWQQVDAQTKRWVHLHAVRVEPAVWRSLWGQLTLADMQRLKEVIEDPQLELEVARTQALLLKKQPVYADAIITLNPKLDAHQRRLQCSLSFKAYFQHLAKDASPEQQAAPSLFGKAIPREFSSPPRR